MAIFTFSLVLDGFQDRVSSFPFRDSFLSRGEKKERGGEEKDLTDKSEREEILFVIVHRYFKLKLI